MFIPFAYVPVFGLPESKENNKLGPRFVGTLALERARERASGFNEIITLYTNTTNYITLNRANNNNEKHSSDSFMFEILLPKSRLRSDTVREEN